MLSGAKSNLRSTQSFRDVPSTLTQYQRCKLRQEIGNLQGQASAHTKAFGDTLELSAEELQQLQDMDASLEKM